MSRPRTRTRSILPLVLVVPYSFFCDRDYQRYLIVQWETRNSGKSERGLVPSSAPLNIDKSIGEWKNGRDQDQVGGRWEA